MGDQQQLLGPRPHAITGLVLRPQPEPASSLLQLPALVRALAAPVRVANVDPQRTGFPEQRRAKVKYLGKVVDELLWMILEPGLPVDPIVSPAIIRRRGHYAGHLDPCAYQPLQRMLHISMQYD